MQLRDIPTLPPFPKDHYFYPWQFQWNKDVKQDLPANMQLNKNLGKEE